MAPTTNPPLTVDAVNYLVHHVVLPPRLPQESDSDPSHERRLIQLVLCALQDLRDGVMGDHLKCLVTSALTTISNLDDIRDTHGGVSEAQLQKALEKLATTSNDETLPLEIKAQNAGLLIKRSGGKVIFDAFELSPTNNAAMNSGGRLARTFPGPSIEVPVSLMQEEDFRQSLAHTLSMLSTQVAPDCRPKVNKNGHLIEEDRDTTSPIMVCEWLLYNLAPLGTMTQSLRITKNTREEVLWNDCRQPWRRLPLWLLVRVTLQLFFTGKATSGQRLDGLYKLFVAQLLSRILQSTINDSARPSSETPHIIIAKIQQRICKLEKLGHSRLVSTRFITNLHGNMKTVHASIDSLWQAQANDERQNLDMSSLHKLQPEDDMDLQLKSLEAFIEGIASRGKDLVCPSFKPVADYPIYPANELPATIVATGDHKYFRIAAFERWVELHLGLWLSTHLRDEQTCTLLRGLIQMYHSVATLAYKQIPVGLSVMYLSLLELWVALDKAACAAHPLLLHYDPVLELDEVQCLVLPFSSQLQRLDVVERYVTSRRCGCIEANPSIMEQFGHPSSFGVKYFDQSPMLQTVLSDVQRTATQKHKDKCDELARLKDRYKALMDQYNTTECEFRQVVTNRRHGYTKSIHSSYCSRCRSKQEANGLGINIYEWPLSPNPAIAKATIFECQPPQPFADWRDTTIFLATDVLGYALDKPVRPSPQYELPKHDGLESILSSRYHKRRIVPISNIKSHTHTHRKFQDTIPGLTESDVCLDYALHYQYCDKASGVYTGRYASTEHIVKRCMYLMPGSRAAGLNVFLRRPPSLPDGRTSNETVASICDCPTQFSIDEYKGFGHISGGRHIIYLNILAQLAAPSVDFSKPETQIIMLQVIEQCGLPGDMSSRVTHSVLQDDLMCNALLTQIEDSLGSVSGNWESWRAVAIFVTLCRRILSLTSSAKVQERSLRFLAAARRVSMDWLTRLKDRAVASTDDEQRSELYSRTTEIALLCCQTLYVDDTHLDNILEQPAALSSFLRSSIIIEENHDAVRPESGLIYQVMLHSWRSFMYRAFHRIRVSVLQDEGPLHVAIHEHWADFQPANRACWKILSDQHQHWLSIQSGSLSVYFNLLTAKLLVNGLPLARLPAEYAQSAVYRQLFGTSTLEVVPADYPGMKFGAKELFRNHTLRFGMNGAHMLLVASRNNSTWDLLPSSIFKHHLPLAFVTDYIHWYNRSENEVRFCSRSDPWAFEHAEWRLEHCGTSWRLTNRANILISPQSSTAQYLSKILHSLEDSEHTHIMLELSSRLLHIKLPRLQLEFTIEHEDDRIFSRQYRGMFIDRVQSVGTLVGLDSKLVLRSGSEIEHRVLLLPVPRECTSENIVLEANPGRHHVSVRINKDKVHKVFAYTLDTTLARVLDSGTTREKLILAFLHALTSHCLPDPLTGYTGTESALIILRSAGLRSFEYLMEEDVGLLHEIASLAPVRSFYPANLMEMQSVDWDYKLPALSQHADLRSAVQEIFQQTETMRMFYPEHPVHTQGWKSSNAHLEMRDSMRTSMFRVHDVGTEVPPSRKDTTYNARDMVTISARGQNAYIAASLITRPIVSLHTKVNDLKNTLLQSCFKGADVQGPSGGLVPSTLKYDAQWLRDPREIAIKYWCDLHCALALKSSACNKYDLMTWISTMAFAKKADIQMIHAFAMFYRSHDMASIAPPALPSFALAAGSVWNPEKLQSIIRAQTKCFDESSEAALPKEGSETDQQHIRRIEGLHESRQTKAIQAFLQALKTQWPTGNPVAPHSAEVGSYINVSGAMPSISAVMRTWFQNSQFMNYLQQATLAMASKQVVSVTCPQPSYTAPIVCHSLDSHEIRFRWEDIFEAKAPVIRRDLADVPYLPTLIPPTEPEIASKISHASSRIGANSVRLEGLCASLKDLANAQFETEYIESLEASCRSLQATRASSTSVLDTCSSSEVQRLLESHLADCFKYFRSLHGAFNKAIAMIGSTIDVGMTVKLSPRIVPSLWLGQLHSDRFHKLPGPWQDVIIEYGLAVTQLHRAQRLFSLSARPIDLMEELQHVGHTNWDPREFPETLLLEAENGIMIRQEQELIASCMRGPQIVDNIVLQLLMGGGKSSTIVPMLATHLSDTKKLVRVVVAKPQSKQMLHMLICKLGSLLNRRVYHMPFTRSMRPSQGEARLIGKLCEECIQNRGVLLVQPEHMLSFRLMAVEGVLAGCSSARALLETQEHLDLVSRDIVDESDENFSVKFELIYTMGSQRSIEFAPERWLIIQAVAGLIPRFAQQVQHERPGSIELLRGDSGRFPRVRILRNDASEHLMTLVAQHIVEFGIPQLSTSSQAPCMQHAVFRYITEVDLTDAEIKLVENSRFWTNSTRSPLLLLRGLFAGGIIAFALSTKRWRVNFGLDPSRIPETPLAVPFRSKDCPSPRSEFSHPDVVILLTLLSYYYGGLTNEQLFDSFAHVLRSDQSAIQYDDWVATASAGLQSKFRQLSGVSTKDRQQCLEDVFPHLRYSKKAIDYYLSFLVFPKAMKEFPQKLSASGWDIGVTKTHPLTGFSGTNDTLHLLPLTVKQLDLPSQNYTNALVLEYLLKEETSVQLLQSRSDGHGSDAEHLLTEVVQMRPEVRVILDCGASILEQGNHQVAELWLSMRDSHVHGVVFFDDEELSVVDRGGRVERLQTSPFAKHLDVCLVYLDEAHTRGTDLKLPRDYRAAVTLGQGLVKDKLTQGCMRMRKLGVGQSVAFIVPEEISTRIRQRLAKPANAPIEVMDVLRWSITETWQDLKKSMPLWAVQGERHERHKGLLCGTTTLAQAEALLEDEAQSLEARYKPRSKGDSATGMLKTWNLENQSIVTILERCNAFDAMRFDAATLSEEQERELAPEIEEQRQVELPARLQHALHVVHPHLRHLVNTGQLPEHSPAFTPAFQSLSSTSAVGDFDLQQFPATLLVTKDFANTVKAPAIAGQSFVSDPYQRPTRFLLSVPEKSSGAISNLIVISPFEANELLPLLRQYAKVTLHIFAPRANAAFASLDKLELYNIGHPFSASKVSRSLTVQLNLFTGSLYLRSFDEYTELCDFLGLLWSKPVEGQNVFADGFIDPPCGRWKLQKSPVPFLRTLLMKIRREGEGIEKTHLGRILNGVRLEESDFESESGVHGI